MLRNWLQTTEVKRTLQRQKKSGPREQRAAVFSLMPRRWVWVDLLKG